MCSYIPGDIINPRDYTHITDAWIHPDGTMYYVSDYGYYNVAIGFGFSGVSGCERASYLHLSQGSFVNVCGILPHPSEKQVDTVLLYCAATKRSPPLWAVYEYEIVEGEYSISSKYKIGLNRKQQDMLYPNSGD